MFHHDQSDCHCPARFDQGKHESYCAANPCGSECFRCALDALARAVLTAVADAARALHAVLGSDEDPEWAALGVALDALDGEN